MPARRSRTLEWRRCLQQVCERKGSLEIAVVSGHDGQDESPHLVWRVRLQQLTDSEIIVEQPATLGRVIHFNTGVGIVAILAVGQNRWMFSTTHLGPIELGVGSGRKITAMRLAMPDCVERCQRRNYCRVPTAALNLPEIEVWPLLDPKSVLIAERANELQFEEDQKRGVTREPAAAQSDQSITPEVGPKFWATLLNIGGGGLGMRVMPEDASTLAHHKLFWLRFSLPPGLTTPICATGKLAHTNVDSTQHTYAGLAFDFSFNPIHQSFVVEQICRYIELQQQTLRRAS